MASMRSTVFVRRLKTMKRVLGFAVGADVEEDQVADDGVPDVGVAERLVQVVDGLAIDTLTIFGVVLDFDGQVAADRLDEQLVFDRDMGVGACPVSVAGGLDPGKVV